MPQKSKSVEANGEMIFQEHCASCHGPDGKAKTELGKKAGAADLTSDTIQRQGDSELAIAIKDGKGKMPAAGKILSDDEIHAVVIHIREFVKNR
jgi:mono/diheme cytochrome c family protein